MVFCSVRDICRKIGEYISRGYQCEIPFHFGNLLTQERRVKFEFNYARFAMILPEKMLKSMDAKEVPLHHIAFRETQQQHHFEDDTIVSKEHHKDVKHHASSQHEKFEHSESIAHTNVHNAYPSALQEMGSLKNTTVSDIPALTMSSSVIGSVPTLFLPATSNTQSDKFNVTAATSESVQNLTTNSDHSSTSVFQNSVGPQFDEEYSANFTMTENISDFSEAAKLLNSKGTTMNLSPRTMVIMIPN